MKWPRRRRKIDARDMQIVEITGAMLSSPVIIEAFVQVPVIKAVGTISTPTFPKGVSYFPEEGSDVEDILG